MNIEDLTIGQVRQIQNLEVGTNSTPVEDSMAGKYCVFRGYNSGVYAGTYLGVEMVGDVTFLRIRDARRLQYQKYNGFTLCSVSENGLHEDSKLSPPVPEFRLNASDVSEQFACSADAAAIIQKLPNGAG